MALDVATLGIAVNSQGVVLASNRLDRMTAAGGRAETTTQRLTRSFFSLRGALTGLGIGFVVREIVKVTDEFNLATARIRLYTDSLEEAAAAQRTLLGVSNETRTDMFSTLELFNRISQARGELNRTTGDLVKFTEQIQKLTVISGANPQEARNAVIQLSQGLSSGELRGEELRAVMEQLPAVARTIAESLGITIGKFREMAFDGQITAQTIVDGILSMAEQTDAKFREVPVTVGQAWQVLKNNAITAIAEVNNAVQGNQTLAQGLMRAAESVGDAIRGVYLFAAAGFDRVRVVFDEWIMLLEQAGVSWGGVKHAAGESLSFIQVYLETLSRAVVDGFTHWPANVKALFTIIIGEADQFKNNFVAFWQTIALVALDQFNAIQHSANILWLNVKQFFAAGVDGALQSLSKLIGGAGGVAMAAGFQDTATRLFAAAGALKDYASNEADVAAQIQAANDARALEQALLLDQIALLDNERRLKNAASQEAIAQALAERDAIIQRMEARLAESRQNREATLDPTTGEIDLSGASGEVKKIEGDLAKLNQFAKQAARNMQSAFADFFFDPFEDGLKGLLRGFIDVIRRMVAEILAQQVLTAMFQGLSGSGGFWGSFADAVVGTSASGSRASGGPVQAGKAYQVAEFRKPEFFIPETNGRIVPADKMGQTLNVTINQDNRGAMSPDQIMRNNQLLRSQILSDVTMMMQRRVMPG